MIVVAIGSLILGVLCGHFFFGSEMSAMADQLSTYGLILLMVTVGIDLGSGKDIFKKMKQHSVKVFLIPLGVAIGTIAAGTLLGCFLGMPVNVSGAISAGFGWYSLSGVLLKEIATPEIGTIAFLSNICREIIAFILIPLVAKYLNHYTAIAPGGATSMDTTLPIVTKSTSEDMAIISIMSGVILTFVVPFLVPMIYNLL